MDIVRYHYRVEKSEIDRKRIQILAPKCVIVPQSACASLTEMVIEHAHDIINKTKMEAMSMFALVPKLKIWNNYAFPSCQSISK